jgi:hypothetical protein
VLSVLLAIAIAVAAAVVVNVQERKKSNVGLPDVVIPAVWVSPPGEAPDAYQLEPYGPSEIAVNDRPIRSRGRD